MATLAIKGHATRGSEVIGLLKMLGGENFYNKDAGRIDVVFYISDDKRIRALGYEYSKKTNATIFTLEEFLEKFPYKVGDRINSKYLKNYEIVKMEWEGSNNRVIYKLKWHGWYSSNELQPYKEQTMEENSVVVNNEHKQLKVHSLRYDKVQLMIDDKYELKQEGNAYYIVKRQQKCPKTYEECCNILGIDTHFCMKYLPHGTFSYKDTTIYNLQELLIYRDSYWKIAGEQMGLGKAWKPDLEGDQVQYNIFNYNNHVDTNSGDTENHILSFPTEEMRDAFYENFKELIEECKELL